MVAVNNRISKVLYRIRSGTESYHARILLLALVTVFAAVGCGGDNGGGGGY